MYGSIRSPLTVVRRRASAAMRLSARQSRHLCICVEISDPVFTVLRSPRLCRDGAVVGRQSSLQLFERVDVVDPLAEPAEQGALLVVDCCSGSGGELVFCSRAAAVTATHLDARSGARKAFVSTAIVLQNTATEPDHPNGKADAQYSRPCIENVMYRWLSAWIPRQWYPSSMSKLSIQSPFRASRRTSFSVSNFVVIAGQNSFMYRRSTTSR